MKPWKTTKYSDALTPGHDTGPQDNAMKKKIIELLDILDEEAGCYRGMKSVLADEEKSISLSRKERFGHVQREKESLVDRIQHCEGMRKKLVDHLSGEYGADPSTVTVSKLGRYLPAPYNEKLQARANRLRSLIADVQMKNKRNQQLIHQYLDLVKGSLTLLARVMNDTSIYQKPGSGHRPGGYCIGGGRIFCGTV